MDVSVMAQKSNRTPVKSPPKVTVTITRGPAARKEMEAMEREAKRDKPKGKRSV
jgi:hypothetical protein